MLVNGRYMDSLYCVWLVIRAGCLGNEALGSKAWMDGALLATGLWSIVPM